LRGGRRGIAGVTDPEQLGDLALDVLADWEAGGFQQIRRCLTHTSPAAVSKVTAADGRAEERVEVRPDGWLRPRSASRKPTWAQRGVFSSDSSSESCARRRSRVGCVEKSEPSERPVARLAGLGDGRVKKKALNASALRRSLVGMRDISR